MARQEPTLKEIAQRINAHLDRFEADLKIKQGRPRYALLLLRRSVGRRSLGQRNLHHLPGSIYPRPRPCSALPCLVGRGEHRAALRG